MYLNRMPKVKSSMICRQVTSKSLRGKNEEQGATSRTASLVHINKFRMIAYEVVTYATCTSVPRN